MPYLCFMVCVCWGGGACHFHEATRNTLANGKVHIAEPQPRNHVSLALHFACLNVAMCLCTRKIIAHKNECGCELVHVHVCLDVCVGVCVSISLAICVPHKVCVFGCLCVCRSGYMYAGLYVCMHAQVLGEKTW